jgi:hypothetical protein
LLLVLCEFWEASKIAMFYVESRAEFIATAISMSYCAVNDGRNITIGRRDEIPIGGSRAA